MSRQSDEGQLPSPRLRLHKHLAESGVASRRKCEELMSAGRVTVDGREIRDLAFTLDPDQHDVRVDGESVARQPKHYFLLNKPVGYVCTHRDPAGRPQAVDLVPIPGLALFTVGRLDESSEGLLIVTNDGAMANRLAHPRYRIPRTYAVEVAGRPTPEALAELRKGMYFAEGFFRLQDVSIVRSQGKITLLEIILTEGKNREVRRLLARVGHKVVSLQRTAFGPLKLGKLPPGEFRPLTSREQSSLVSLGASPRKRDGNAAAKEPAKSQGARAGMQKSSEAGKSPRSGAARRPGRPKGKSSQRRSGERRAKVRRGSGRG